MKKLNFLLAVALAIFTMFVVNLAYAATSVVAPAAAAAVTYPVAIQPLVSQADSFIFAFLSALVSWAVTWVGGKYKLNQATTAMAATTLASGLAMAHTKALAAEQDIKDPQVKSQMVAEAVTFFEQEVPVALSSLGLTQQKLIAMTVAHLPAVQAGIVAGTAAAATTDPSATVAGATSTAASGAATSSAAAGG